MVIMVIYSHNFTYSVVTVPALAGPVTMFQMTGQLLQPGTSQVGSYLPSLPWVVHAQEDFEYFEQLWTVSCHQIMRSESHRISQNFWKIWVHELPEPQLSRHSPLFFLNGHPMSWGSYCTILRAPSSAVELPLLSNLCVVEIRWVGSPKHLSCLSIPSSGWPFPGHRWVQIYVAESPPKWNTHIPHHAFMIILHHSGHRSIACPVPAKALGHRGRFLWQSPLEVLWHDRKDLAGKIQQKRSTAHVSHKSSP